MPRRLLVLLTAAVVGGVFVAGLFIHGVVGGALLVLTDAVLVTMAKINWRHLRPRDRVIRVVVIAAIAAIAVAKRVG